MVAELKTAVEAAKEMQAMDIPDDSSEAAAARGKLDRGHTHWLTLALKLRLIHHDVNMQLKQKVVWRT